MTRNRRRHSQDTNKTAVTQRMRWTGRRMKNSEAWGGDRWVKLQVTTVLMEGHLSGNHPLLHHVHGVLPVLSVWRVYVTVFSHFNHNKASFFSFRVHPSFKRTPFVITHSNVSCYTTETRANRASMLMAVSIYVLLTHRYEGIQKTNKQTNRGYLPSASLSETLLISFCHSARRFPFG